MTTQPIRQQIPASNPPSLEEIARFSDPSFMANPYPVYAQLRREAPVWWCEGASAWIVTRYADVRAVLRDPASFSSAPRSSRRPPYDDPESGMIIVTDRPKHGPARRVFVGGGSFTARSAEKWRPEIRAMCEEFVERLPAGEIDAVAGVAFPLVVRLAERFFDLPEPEPGEARWQDCLLIYYHPGTGDLTSGTIRYLQRVMMTRRQSPGTDPISLAVLANSRAALLTDEQMAWNLYDAVLAGAASMIAVAAEAIGALAERPDTQDPRYWTAMSAAKRSAEELLRWTNHIHLLTRTAIRDMTFGGQPIRAGDVVYPVLASANRDEAVWDHGEDLDLAREPRSANLAFGYGPHAATGALLARAFLSTLLPVFVSARRPFQLGGQPQRARTRGISTPRQIPIAPRAPTMPASALRC